MRKSFICILACMSLFVAMVSCGGSHSSNEVAILKDSIAALQVQLENASKVGNERASSRTDGRKSSAEIVGTYSFTDKLRDKWILILNEDKSGQLKKENFVAYCSWKDFRNIDEGIQIMFGADRPTIWFEKGEESIWVTHIIDGYIYASNTIATTKDPNWRLPITKIKE